LADVREKTWDVVGAFMSPVHDKYSKEGLVPAFHRVQMCEKAAESSDWIAVTKWEAEQKEWTPTFRVLQAYEKALNESNLYTRQVHFKLVCGADLLVSLSTPGSWKKENLANLLGNYGVVCIERTGAEPLDGLVQASAILSTYAHNIDLVPQTIVNTVSSTGIRDHLSKNLSVKYLIPDPVIKYIYRNSLYGHTIAQDRLIRRKSLVGLEQEERQDKKEKKYESPS